MSLISIIKFGITADEELEMPGSPLEADVICSGSCDSTYQQENPSSYDFETDDDISTEQGDDSGIFV